MAVVYRPRGIPRTSAFIAVIAGALGAAVLLAFFWGYLGNLGRIVFIETLVPALLISKWVAWLCRRTRFFWPKTAVLITIVATSIAIVGALYDAHRVDKNKAIAHAQEVLNVSADSSTLENYYQEELDALTFSNYLRIYFSGDEASADGGSSTFGSRWGIALFCLEVLIALFIAAYEPSGVASEPVCERCGNWLVANPGRIAALGIANAVSCEVLRGNIKSGAELLVSPDTKETTEFAIAHCLVHNSSTVLRITEHYLDRQSRQLKARHYKDIALTGNELQSFKPYLQQLPLQEEEPSLG